MIRLAIEVTGAPGRVVPVSADDWHYLVDVMRRRPGDRIEALAPDGTVWSARLGESGSLQLESRATEIVRPGRSITLFQALLKGDHFGEVVERGTEAGISVFVPMVTARSIVRAVSPNKEARWRTIAKEASEQSRGARVPAIEPLVDCKNVEPPPGSLAFVLDPRAPYRSVWLDSADQPVALAVGPEGGFAPDEYEGLYARGFQPLSLGPRVYRAENAGAFAAVLFLQAVNPTFGQHC